MNIMTFSLMICIMPLLTIPGDKPGIVDYMIWPWGERLDVLRLIAGEKYELPKERFPRLVSLSPSCFYKFDNVTALSVVL